MYNLPKEITMRRSAMLVTISTICSVLIGCQGYNYSKMENEVYAFADGLSREIPKEFVKKDKCYHDNSLKLDDKCSLGSEFAGKGRAVFPAGPDGIYVGYTDAKECFAYLRTNDPNELRHHMMFFRILVGEEQLNELAKLASDFGVRPFSADELGERPFPVDELKEQISYDELIILGNSGDVVVYLRNGSKWNKHNNISYNYSAWIIAVKMIDNLDTQSESVPAGQLKRYKELSHRLMTTYFAGEEK